MYYHHSLSAYPIYYDILSLHAIDLCIQYRIQTFIRYSCVGKGLVIRLSLLKKIIKDNLILSVSVISQGLKLRHEEKEVPTSIINLEILLVHHVSNASVTIENFECI